MLPAAAPAEGDATMQSVAPIAASLRHVGLVLMVVGGGMVLLSFDYLTAALSIAAGAVTFQSFGQPLDVVFRRSARSVPPSLPASSPPPSDRDCCFDCCGCGSPRHVRPLMIALIVFACLGFAWTITLAVILGVFVGGWAASWAAFGAIGDAAVIVTSGVGIGRIVEWEVRLREAVLAGSAGGGGGGAGGLVSYGIPGGGQDSGARIFVVSGGPGPFPGPFASAAVYPAGPQFYGGPAAVLPPPPSPAQMYPAPSADPAAASVPSAQQEYAAAAGGKGGARAPAG